MPESYRSIEYKYTRIQKRIEKEYVNKWYNKVHKSVEMYIEILFSSYKRNDVVVILSNYGFFQCRKIII